MRDLRDLDWTAIIIVSVLLVLFTPRLWAQEWHPTIDYTEVVVMMHWTHQTPVPCGQHTNALACAFLPDKDLIQEHKGSLCKMFLKKTTQHPSDEELRNIGKIFQTCLSTGRSTIVLSVTYIENTSGGGAAFQDGKMISLPGGPCTISISPEARAFRIGNNRVRSLGHEVLHCLRGSWHD